MSAPFSLCDPVRRSSDLAVIAETHRHDGDEARVSEDIDASVGELDGAAVGSRASIAASSSFTTFFMRMRLEWKVKRSGRMVWRAASMAGISVSIVVLELGTIWPIRYIFLHG